MTVGELIQKLYKFNPNLEVVFPSQSFFQGSEYTGTIVVDTELTIDDVLDFETKIVITTKEKE